MLFFATKTQRHEGKLDHWHEGKLDADLFRIAYVVYRMSLEEFISREKAQNAPH